MGISQTFIGRRGTVLNKINDHNYKLKVKSNKTIIHLLLPISEVYFETSFTTWKMFCLIFENYCTVPGKVPRNLSVDAISTTGLSIHWEFPPPSFQTPIPTTALRIFYKLQGNTTWLNTIDVNFTAGYFILGHLEKFTWYTVWVRAVTARGLGIESQRFSIRTLEEGTSKTHLSF